MSMEASFCNPSLMSSSVFSKSYSVFFSCPNFKPFSPVRPSRFSTVPIAVETIDEEIETKSFSRRRLILLRHAQSSWEDTSVKDHDRPLSKAGRADAVKVSKKLHQLGWVPQLILSSNAVRTRETLNIMQEQLRGLLEAEVHFLSSFYSIAAMDGQTAEHLQQAICKYSRDEILTVMCMGHNRGWEEAASVFSGSLVELKTCNAALLEATGKSWEEWRERLMFLHSYSFCMEAPCEGNAIRVCTFCRQSRLEVCNHCRAFVRLDTLKGSRAVAVRIKFQSIRDKMSSITRIKLRAFGYVALGPYMSSITRIKLRAFGYVALGPYTSPKSNN